MSVATSTERAQPGRVRQDAGAGLCPGSIAGRSEPAPSVSRGDRPLRRDCPWLIPLALFAGVLAVYLRTLRPTFGWLDTSELITAAYHLGIGHNPGYPTFMLIGHLFSWLPIGSVAYRLNLMAATCGALAVVLLYLVCLRVTRPSTSIGTGNRVASVFAALTFAFSYTFWDLTTEAEVYTLHGCFMLGVLLLLLRWRDGGRDRDLYLGWLVVGVSLGNHALTALMIPALALLVLLSRGWRELGRGRIGGCLGALLAGTMVYLYVPLRALANPPPEVNNPHSLHAFWQLISAPGSHQLMFSMGAGEVALRALGFARRTVRELGPLGIGAALLGIGVALRGNRRPAVALLVLLGIDVFYALNYDIFDIYTYFLPAYLVLAVLMAIGLQRVLAWGERGLAWLQQGREAGLTRPRRIALVAALVSYLPVWAFSANFRLVDASQDYSAEDFARNAFAVAAPNALIIGDWWSTAPLGYLKYVEGLRPDVTLSVALSSADPAGARRVLRKAFLQSYPAVYLAECQTSWKGEFKRRYAHEDIGDLMRVYPDGKPRLRAVADPAAPAFRFGGALGLIATTCEPTPVAQGAILRVTHRWKKLAPAVEPLETLTSLQGPDGAVWRARSELANGFYDAQTWRPGEVAQEPHLAFIPGDAPPGRYAVTVRVRSRDTRKCLEVAGEGIAEPTLEVTTARVRIVPRGARK